MELRDNIKSIENKIELIDKNINEIIININKILNLLENKINPNCQKMGEHINFIEKIYENVKHPLGFFCSFINTSTDTNNYSLTDISN